MTSWRFLLRFVAGGAMLAAASLPALADTPHGDFPLGQTDSGAICSAVETFDDQAAEMRGSHSWAIRCLGFDTIFGHLYAYERDGASAVAANGPWQTQLATRAQCDAFGPASLSGVNGAQAASCKPKRGSVNYRAYSAVDGDHAAAAEGFAPIQPLVELGLKIVMGDASVPSSALQTVSGGPGGGLQNLLAAENASSDLNDVNSRAQTENKGWEFADAERDFRSLEDAPGVTDEQKVIARYNIALNVSNEGPGKFAEAEKDFDSASAQAAALHDRSIDALALNYRALLSMNERHYTDAIASAEKAIAMRHDIDPNLAQGGTAVSITVDKADGTLVVPQQLANELNTGGRSTGLNVVPLSQAERLQIQDAQAQYIIGAARNLLGDRVAARANLEAADKTLSAGRLATARSAAWLHAEVYLILGDMDLREAHNDAAATDFRNALEICDRVTVLSATPFEGDLLLNLARVEAKLGQGDKALEDYQRGLTVYRTGQRDMGGARNLTAPYFDLLLQRIQAGGAGAADAQSQYFDTMQVMAGQGTAKVFAEFAAAASKGDQKSEQLAREVKDTNHQIDLKEQQIRHEQDLGTYTPDQKAADDAQLKTWADTASAIEQQLLEANPRYGQVVEATATLPDMQKALEPGEVYVKTVLLADRGFGIAITRDKVVAYPIALTRAQIETRVAELRKSLELGGGTFSVAKAHALFVSVFGPAQDDVRSAHHLIYDPDSLMVSLPAAVFVTDDASADKFNKAVAYFKANHVRTDLYHDTQWLGRNTDVSLAISSEVFLQSRAIAPSKGQRGFVAFGDPVTKGAEPRRYALLTVDRTGQNLQFCEINREKHAALGFASLAPIRPAIETIGQEFHASGDDVVLGTAFTDDAVLARQDLNNYRVVFFGTHGALPQQDPSHCLPLPVLLTSLGPQQDSDGFLDAQKILKLKMDADLVVLAACNTGGPASEAGLAESGDAFDGFARDFIFAGARNLVVSQWPVDVRKTSELMEKMFGANAGTQADALKQAQVALMDDPNYSHPYYWAAFTLVGDGARAMPKP